jgi:hypothetical protein
MTHPPRCHSKIQSCSTLLWGCDVHLNPNRRASAGASGERADAEEENARSATQAARTAAECTQLHAQVAELQWQSELYHEQAEQAQATVRAWEAHGPASSMQPLCAVVPQPQPQGDEGASTERSRLEAAAAVSVELEALRLTTERERRSAAEREDTLHAQVASLQQHLRAACTPEEPQATLEAGLEGRSRSPGVQESRPRLAPEGVEGGAVDRGSEPAPGGARDANRARRLSGQGDTADWQLRRGAGSGFTVGSGNRDGRAV